MKVTRTEGCIFIHRDDVPPHYGRVITVKEAYGSCCGMRELGGMDWLWNYGNPDIIKAVADTLNTFFAGGQVSFILSNHQKRAAKGQLAHMKKEYGLRYMRLYNFNMRGWMHFYVWTIKKKEAPRRSAV